MRRGSRSSSSPQTGATEVMADGMAEPPRKRRFGRPRTSTIVLAVAFVAVFALWILVRPVPVTTYTTPDGRTFTVRQGSGTATVPGLNPAPTQTSAPSPTATPTRHRTQSPTPTASPDQSPTQSPTSGQSYSPTGTAPATSAPSPTRSPAPAGSPTPTGGNFGVPSPGTSARAPAGAGLQSP